MVSNELSAHGHKCPAGWTRRETELSGLFSAEREQRQVPVSTSPAVRADISLQSQEAWRPQRTSCVWGLEEGGKAHLETGELFCQKTNVCQTRHAGNPGASNSSAGCTTMLCLLVPCSGAEKIRHRKVLVFLGEKQAHDSDSSRGTQDARGEKVNSICQRHFLPVSPPSKLGRRPPKEETILEARAMSDQWLMPFKTGHVFPLSKPGCPEKGREAVSTVTRLSAVPSLMTHSCSKGTEDSGRYSCLPSPPPKTFPHLLSGETEAREGQTVFLQLSYWSSHTPGRTLGLSESFAIFHCLSA